MAKHPDQQVYQMLSTNGDCTGTTNAIGNYSVTQGEFYITPPVYKKCVIARMIVFIEDAAAAFNADNYGGLATALTNGVQVVCKDQNGNIVLDLTAGSPIKSNAQWGQHCYDATEGGFGSGNDFLQVRWTFAKAGNPVYLQKADRLSVLIDDDLTGLISHTFIVQGYLE